MSHALLGRSVASVHSRIRSAVLWLHTVGLGGETTLVQLWLLPQLCAIQSCSRSSLLEQPLPYKPTATGTRQHRSSIPTTAASGLGGGTALCSLRKFGFRLTFPSKFASWALMVVVLILPQPCWRGGGCCSPAAV